MLDPDKFSTPIRYSGPLITLIALELEDRKRSIDVPFQLALSISTTTTSTNLTPQKETQIKLLSRVLLEDIFT